MNLKTLNIERTGGIVTITIDRESANNTLNGDTLRELRDTLLGLSEERPLPNAIILTGAGNKAFAGGLEVAEMLNGDSISGGGQSRLGQEVCNLLDRIPIPTIAAVNGIAVGGGLELSMACDIAIASENAIFSQVETQAGLIPGFGGTWRLPQRVGTMRARYLTYTAEALDAQKALGWGLVMEVVPSDQLLTRCREIAAQIAASDPAAVAEAKRVISANVDLTLEASNIIERRAFAAFFDTDEMHKRMARIGEVRPVWWPKTDDVIG